MTFEHAETLQDYAHTLGESAIILQDMETGEHALWLSAQWDEVFMAAGLNRSDYHFNGKVVF